MATRTKVRIRSCGGAEAQQDGGGTFSLEEIQEQVIHKRHHRNPFAYKGFTTAPLETLETDGREKQAQLKEKEGSAKVDDELFVLSSKIRDLAVSIGLRTEIVGKMESALLKESIAVAKEADSITEALAREAEREDASARRNSARPTKRNQPLEVNAHEGIERDKTTRRKKGRSGEPDGNDDVNQKSLDADTLESSEKKSREKRKLDCEKCVPAVEVECPSAVEIKEDDVPEGLDLLLDKVILQKNEMGAPSEEILMELRNIPESPNCAKESSPSSPEQQGATVEVDLRSRRRRRVISASPEPEIPEESGALALPDASPPKETSYNPHVGECDQDDYIRTPVEVSFSPGESVRSPFSVVHSACQEPPKVSPIPPPPKRRSNSKKMGDWTAPAMRFSVELNMMKPLSTMERCFLRREPVGVPAGKRFQCVQYIGGIPLV